MKLVLRGHPLDPGRGRPIVMGILNASPESFSDGPPVARATGALVERGHALATAGAHLIDVGGESGVTNRAPIAADEEIERAVPVIEELASEGIATSIDTWKVEVAAAALDAGAVLVNDVSGLRDPALADAVAEARAGLVITHTRAEPKMKAFPPYDDVAADCEAFLRERVAVAVGRGVDPDQIVLDPGPDLAKTPADTVAALRALSRLAELGHPLLLAVSRKDFVGAITGRRPLDRLPGTLAALAAGLDAGADIVRVHDVAEVSDFLRVRAALRGDEQLPADLRLAEGLLREDLEEQEEPAA